MLPRLTLSYDTSSSASVQPPVERRLSLGSLEEDEVVEFDPDKASDTIQSFNWSDINSITSWIEHLYSQCPNQAPTDSLSQELAELVSSLSPTSLKIAITTLRPKSNVGKDKKTLQNILTTLVERLHPSDSISELKANAREASPTATEPPTM